ncbi:SsrA-binding protein SmpB [Candidatus Ishikawella capsulata]|uniref:SsrA-binding protein SmpB n=1 Tax=Candidatus Ishikawella capsulata TaxID=168169 RepID=UPI000596EBAC|nr:SsrA-binding protein SmpB [Candidatus Ishikawaella capsulata]
MNKRKDNIPSSIITKNKGAYYKYNIEKELIAGIVLEGWEVKAIRAGKINITDSYISLQKGEAYLFGATFQPLAMASSHIICEAVRPRKLLLNRQEIKLIYNYINRDGYTSIPLSLYWKNAWCKITIGIARGKKYHDKRSTIKKREWEVYKKRLLKKQKY